MRVERRRRLRATVYDCSFRLREAEESSRHSFHRAHAQRSQTEPVDHQARNRLYSPGSRLETLLGRTTVKAEPTPTLLSISSFPLFISTNFLQSIRPSPVPFSLCVPFFTMGLSKRKILLISSDVMPMPESFTDTITSSPFSEASTRMVFISGVNLMAFDTRFRNNT